MAGHSHVCWKCEGVIECNAPIVRDPDAPQNICIVAFEEGEDGLLCDNCESAQGELQSEMRLIQAAWDQGQSAAAPRMADMAKRLSSPFMSERANLTTMRCGVDLALHEIEMECIREAGKGKRSISFVNLSKRFKQLRDSLDALTPPEGK